MTNFVGKSLVYKGWSEVYQLEFHSPDGSKYTRQVEDHGAGSCVLPYDDSRGVVTLVVQERAAALFVGVPSRKIEAPAGLLDHNELPEVAALREILEETGIRLRILQNIGTFWTGPGFSTERLTLFLANYSLQDIRGPGGGLLSENEHIEVIEIPLARASAMVDSGDIDDLKTAYLIRELERRLTSPA